jgi:hypothetical protein
MEFLLRKTLDGLDFDGQRLLADVSGRILR